jgi:hypothetical protein
MICWILGIFAASAVAPYLGATCHLVSMGLRDPGLPSLQTAVEFFPGIVMFGTVGLFLYGTPVLAAVATAALVLHALDARSPFFVTAITSLMGLCFGLYMTSPNFDEWPLIPSAFISAAICGWIYWRIAIRGEGPHPPARDSSPHQ